MAGISRRLDSLRSIFFQHLWPLRRGRLAFLWRRIRHDWERVHVAPSEYSGHVSVWDLGRERRLVFSEWLDLSVESVIFTSGDWDELQREYWGQAMLTPKPLTPNPSVLIFGLGGGTMVHLANRMLSPGRITVVELDPAVVETAKSHMGLDAFRNVRFMTMDALAAIDELSGVESFDFIIEDCFYEGMNERTDDFVRGYIRSQESLLADEGTLVFNRWFRTWDGEEIDSDQERLERFLKERFATVSRKQIEQRWLNELFFVTDPITVGSEPAGAAETSQH